MGRATMAGRPCIVGDLCYERALADSVLPWLHRLAAAGACVLLGDPGRDYFSDRGMIFLARYAIPTSLDLEANAMRETSVYRLEPR